MAMHAQQTFSGDLKFYWIVFISEHCSPVQKPLNK